LGNIVPLPLVMRNPTIKLENKLYNSEINMGFLNYPVSQTADVILLNGDLVPVGEDQTPILDFANDVIEKFHHQFKCKMFKKIKPLLSSTPRLMGLDGVNKMSKSLGNAIFLSDSEKEIKKKIKQLYTDNGHLTIDSPGKVEGNVVFYFLDVFMQEKDELQSLKEHYQKGGLGDAYLKDLLFTKMMDVLRPIQEKRNLLNDDDYLLDVLRSGTQTANTLAELRMERVRNIIFDKIY